MSKEELLKELLVQWKGKQKESDIFCPDGFLGNSDVVDILFICRESHVDENAIGEQKFWMYDVVNQPNKGDDVSQFDKNEKRGRTKYYNCLKMLAKDTDLRSCAYININKMGGSSSCDMKRLEDYADKYSTEIKEEINIINPDKIIILGRLSQKIYDIIRDAKIPTKVYPFHPSVYRRNYVLEELP